MGATTEHPRGGGRRRRGAVVSLIGATALLAVDRPRDLAQGRRLIERGLPLDPVRAADPSVPIRSATATIWRSFCRI